MKKQKVNRKYNFPDADLYQMAMDAIRLAKRDLEQFKAGYEYDAHRLKGFHDRCQRFVAMPDDNELLGDQMIVTDKKYEAAEQLRHMIRSVMTRVRMAFSNRTGRYRKFGTAKMGDMTDAQLLFCGRPRHPRSPRPVGLSGRHRPQRDPPRAPRRRLQSLRAGHERTAG